MTTFTKAVKYGAKLRMAIMGISGSGKTYSALRIATSLGSRVAFIDTERGSARKYSDMFDFDVMELDSFAVENFIAGIEAAENGGYDVLIIDSLSHAWAGKDGILEFVDAETARSRAKNAYTSGWRSATPLHNRLVDTILTCKLHVIACMRTKADYVQESVNGKTVPRKVGLAPVQREGMEYEFDVVGDMDDEHNLIISKTRCQVLDKKLFPFPGEDVAAILREWLMGEPAPATAPKPVSSPVQQSQPVAPVKASTAAPAAEPSKPPIQDPVFDDSEAEAIYKKLRQKIMNMHTGKLFGFHDSDVLREHMLRALHVPNIRLVTDAHRSAMVAWYDYLTDMLDKTDSPFEPIPFFDYPDPASEPASEPASSEIDFDALLAEIDAEITARKIDDSMATFLADSAMKLHASKSPSLSSILANVKSFPLKNDPAAANTAADDVKNLQGEVKFIIQQLVTGQIDGFHKPERFNKSIFDHLGVKRVGDCKDVKKLAAYIVHLNKILNLEIKEELEVKGEEVA